MIDVCLSSHNIYHHIAQPYSTLLGVNIFLVYHMTCYRAHSTFCLLPHIYTIQSVSLGTCNLFLLPPWPAGILIRCELNKQAGDAVSKTSIAQNTIFKRKMCFLRGVGCGSECLYRNSTLPLLL